MGKERRRSIHFLLNHPAKSSSATPPASQLDFLLRKRGRPFHFLLHDRIWCSVSHESWRTRAEESKSSSHTQYLISQEMGDSPSRQGWRVRFIFNYTTPIRVRYNAPSYATPPLGIARLLTYLPSSLCHGGSLDARITISSDGLGDGAIV